MMMEAVRTSELSVNFNVTTRHYIPEDSKLHTHCRENLKFLKFLPEHGRRDGQIQAYQICKYIYIYIYIYIYTHTYIHIYVRFKKGTESSGAFSFRREINHASTQSGLQWDRETNAQVTACFVVCEHCMSAHGIPCSCFLTKLVKNRVSIFKSVPHSFRSLFQLHQTVMKRSTHF
jgi:hypothetical protein